MNKIGLLICFLMVVGLSVSAQKLSGDITPLKGQKEVNVVLDFSGTLVNGKAEEIYISKETNGKTEIEKEKWLSEWNENLRTESYNFLISGLQKGLGEKVLWIGEHKDAEYTIDVKVRNITTGHSTIISKPSSIKAEVFIIKTGEQTPIATIEFKNSCNGVSASFSNFVYRIAFSFATLGYDIGRIINNKMEK